jgi:hypothetical protein
MVGASLRQIELLPPIPSDTQQAARQEFLVKNPYLAIGDSFDHIFDRIDLEKFSRFGLDSLDRICRLALITAFQFAESLPDETAALYSQSRLDWKYALHLPLGYPGIQAVELCRFRMAILTFLESEQEFRKLLDHLWEVGLFENPECWETGHRVGLRLVCNITRLDNLMKAMTRTLEALATSHPDWLNEKMLPHWHERYALPADEKTFSCQIKVQRMLALELGNDIKYLISELEKQFKLNDAILPDFSNLQNIWNAQFKQNQNEFHWREGGCSFCS